MFSNRFNQIHQKTDIIWKYQQYQLVYEYKNRLAFPSPFSFISYFIMGFGETYIDDMLEGFDADSNSKTWRLALSLENRFAHEVHVNMMQNKDNSDAKFDCDCN